MADKKLEDLTATSSLSGTDLLYVVSASNSRKIAFSDFLLGIFPAYVVGDAGKFLRIDEDGTALAWEVPGAEFWQTGAQIVEAIDTELGSDDWQSGPMTGAQIVEAIDTELGSDDWQSGGGGSSLVSINNQTASYTLVLGDGGKYVRMNVASANSLTVPNAATVDFPIGTIIQIRQSGAGQTTVVADSGVTINTSETLKLRKIGASGALVKVASDEWDLTGDLELA